MADWYLSSTSWATLPQWAASTAYTVGQFIRPLALSNTNYYQVFRCTTAGTSAATEASWSFNNNATTTSGTAVFTCVTGQSTYGWTAAAGLLTSLILSGTGRGLVGDRIFVSSDHSETTGGFLFNSLTHAHGLISLISVNKAGSVPPVAADIQSGATLGTSSANTILDAYCNLFLQGFTITGQSNIYFGSSGDKSIYFKNCSLQLIGAGASARIGANVACRAIFDNTTVQFSAVTQSIGSAAGSAPFELIWINTPNAIVGAFIPNILFTHTVTALMQATCRGVDLSAVTTTLLTGTVAAAVNIKVLLDSCKIAPGVARIGVPPGTTTPAHNEIELVNCYDGTNTINERHTSVGSVVIDTATTMTGGADNYAGHYSLKLTSSPRSDYCTLPLEAFWLDVGNTAIGSSKTTTVEVISSGSLNNTDIKLLLEYPDQTAATATVWDSASATAVTLSGGGLVATNTGTTSADQGAHVHAMYGRDSGKYYFEATFTTLIAGNNIGVGVGTTASTYTNIGNNATIGTVSYTTGSVYSNGSLALTWTAWAFGSTMAFAVDLDNRKFWVHTASGGNWNNSGTANPATNVGGIAIPAGTMVPFVTFGGTSGAANNVITTNFGASTFIGTVPSGFTSGWPSTATRMADFTESLSSVLATSTPLPTSVATWTAPTNTRWNPIDVTNAVVSNNNLSVTGTGGSGGARGSNGAIIGKYYWETTITVWANANTGCGLILGTAALSGGAPVGAAGFTKTTGTISVNTVSSGKSLGARSAGDTFGIAVDLGAQLIWFRVAPSGNWNGDAAANPATGTGGVSISTISGVLHPYFGIFSSSDACTANFGDSAFLGSVPSGFVPGWLNTLTKQSLQTTFTPQTAGRVRGLVKLGKTNTTMWVNPKVTIT